jgi:hypothetical protein
VAEIEEEQESDDALVVALAICLVFIDAFAVETSNFANFSYCHYYSSF